MPALSLCDQLHHIDHFTILPNIAVGDKVLDFPSNTITTVAELGLSERVVYIRLDDSTPTDPTGDGAFPSHWRTTTEIGPADQPRPDDWTY